MANELPITLVLSGALPAGFTGTPQQLAEAIVARARLQSSQSFSLFATGSTEPSSNVGPWLKDGFEWWVWDNDIGAYKPQILNLGSVDDGAIPQSKLATDSVGTLQLIDGSVTDAKLAVSARSPFRATTGGTSQVIPVGNLAFAWQDLQFPTESFDPNNAYSPVTSLFTAAVTGYYFASYFLQIDNSTTDASSPTNMQIGAELVDGSSNGNLGIGSTDNRGRATAGSWFTQASGVVFMNAGQTAKMRAYAINGVGGTSADMSVWCHWSMFLVQQLIA